MVRAFIILASLAVASAASAQAKPGIAIRVGFDHYDSEHDTYSGGVTVSAAPCPNVDYNVRIGFAGAKDAEAALKQTRATVIKLVANIRQAAAHCR